MYSTVSLPDDHRLYTDVYFLHAARILKAEGLNPRVTMQVFIRRGPGKVYGIDQALDILRRFAPDSGKNLTVHALPEGSEFGPSEPLMHIKGPLLDFVELETLYLGCLTAATSRGMGIPDPDPAQVKRLAAQIRSALPSRKRIMYFGARHWHWAVDEAVSKAAISGGFDACSTDAGADAAGLSGGVGTTPHALILAFASRFGRDRATAEAIRAFDEHIAADQPRIALVDTFNREVDDSLASAVLLGNRLAGVRLDTAGENIAQGGVPTGGARFWTGHGVTVESARAVRRALDAAGREDVGIVLSSGFGDLDKIRAFVAGEEKYGRLFESIGIGGLFDAAFATADIVRIDGRNVAKVGRGYMPNPRMQRVI